MNDETEIQNIDVIKDNPIGLPSYAAKEIADELDILLSSYSVQFHQYLKHHWIVEGPEHRDLHAFFDDAYEEIKTQLDAIAERMTVLGALPTSSMRTQLKKSFIESESDNALPIRQMLESDLDNEKALISNLRSLIKKVSKLSDFGTETMLKGFLAAREHCAHEIDHYLSLDSLSKKTFADSSL